MKIRRYTSPAIRISFASRRAGPTEVPAKYEFDIDDLAEPKNLAVLQAVFHNPEALRSKRTRAALTKEAADKFQTISDRLQHRNSDREAVAHFVNQLVFCFFADSVGLLPNGLWRRLLQTAERKPGQAKKFLDRLFADMEKGGDFDLEDIAHFNGGLFDGRGALPLEEGEIGLLFAAASLDWALIDPTIFGTLFERFLDPDKRAQIGAHYTDPDKIMMIVEPVVMRPLRARWAEAKKEIEAIMAPVLAEKGPNGRHASKNLEKRFEAARAKAEVARDKFIDGLCALRILDPACGSGNFLYLALQAVKDLEYRAILECEELHLGRVVPRVGPEILHGIEINPLAAELARTTIWIGDIQWRVRNAISHHPRPVLRKLDTIECRDALVASDRRDGFVEAEWPEADFIIGNPPFLGTKKMMSGLGVDYVRALRKTYEGRLSPFSDLVCWWFEKARSAVAAGKASRVGLVATNSIRGGKNRLVLDAISRDLKIFEAHSDEPWTVEGAAVRVSLICFASIPEQASRLDGREVAKIHSDLSTGTNLPTAARLRENEGASFVGIQKSGPFDVDGTVARSWLLAPINVNKRPNSDVLRPYWNGIDVVRRRRDKWLIDFSNLSEKEAALYQQPFEHAATKVKPFRQASAISDFDWWRLWRPRPELVHAAAYVTRMIVIPEIAKHRVFVWIDMTTGPDKNLTVIARDDDTAFGILHSRFHEEWSLRLGTSLEDRPRYTPTTTFETFPFPEGLTPNIPAREYAHDRRAKRIAAAAKKLDDLRQAWLNPPDLVEIVPEVTPTAAPGEAPARYPDRILPKNAEAAVKLKERTLTNLYNQRPRWLADAHDELDRAVAAAYGWPEDIAIEDALARLLKLNLERAAAEGKEEGAT